MSEIENKIMGKSRQEKNKKETFDINSSWFVTKEGCGKTLINGRMIHEMLSPNAKKKLMKGCKKISDRNFIFEKIN